MGRRRPRRGGPPVRAVRHRRRPRSRRHGDASGAGDILARRLIRAGSRVAPVLASALLWELAARLVGNRLFPPPSAVLGVLVDQALHGPLLRDLAITMTRVAWAFAIAMLGGAALGIAMGRLPWLDRLLDSLLLILLNLPALVGIVLIYVWFGLGEATTVLAVAINKLPSTAITMREGARALDPALLEMGASFRVGRFRLWREVALPQLYPYLFAAARSGLALIWKIVLVAELLGRTNGIGFQIEVFFQLFDVRGILAYTLAFMLVVQLIEWAVLQPLERRAMRWR